MQSTKRVLQLGACPLFEVQGLETPETWAKLYQLDVVK